jgi:small subunit ribosomal protein S6
MRLYDIVMVLSPDKSADEAASLAEGFKKILSDDGATLVKDEPWGKRRLAYPIAKKREGIYHYFQAEARGETIAEVERKLKLSDDVLRHLAVRADEEIRRGVKLKKRREAKAARKPPKKVAPESPAAEAPAPADEAEGAAK